MSELQKAASLIKSGQKAEARQILLPFLKENRNHEQGWLLMARCAANKKELEASLRQVLRLNPQNEVALEVARRYDILVPAPSAPAQTVPTAPARPAVPERPVSPPPAAKIQVQSRPMPRRRSQLPAVIGLIFMLVVIIGMVLLVLLSLSEDDEELSDSAIEATNQSATQIALQNAAQLELLQAQYATSVASFRDVSTGNGRIEGVTVGNEEAVFAGDASINVELNLVPHQQTLPVLLRVHPADSLDQEIATLEVLAEPPGEEAQALELALAPPADGWLPGEYVLVILLDNQIAYSTGFQVTGE
jgi:hypothetical protein